MKRTIIVCDRCNQETVGALQVKASAPIRHDAPGASEPPDLEIDLCGPCCQHELQQLLLKLPLDDRYRWVEKVKRMNYPKAKDVD